MQHLFRAEKGHLLARKGSRMAKPLSSNQHKRRRCVATSRSRSSPCMFDLKTIHHASPHSLGASEKSHWLFVSDECCGLPWGRYRAEIADAATGRDFWVLSQSNPDLLIPPVYWGGTRLEREGKVVRCRRRCSKHAVRRFRGGGPIFKRHWVCGECHLSPCFLGMPSGGL